MSEETRVQRERRIIADALKWNCENRLQQFGFNELRTGMSSLEPRNCGRCRTCNIGAAIVAGHYVGATEGKETWTDESITEGELKNFVESVRKLFPNKKLSSGHGMELRRVLHLLEEYARHLCAQGYVCKAGATCTSDHK